MEIWRPRVTVAAVIERDGRFLMVEERIDGELVLNQPAGHLDPDEPLTAAAARETLEETGWRFEPTALVRVYHWPHPHKDITFVRFVFSGRLIEHDPERTLDTEIVRTLWLTPEELERERPRHRSPMVWDSVQDYLHGPHVPLNVLKEYY